MHHRMFASKINGINKHLQKSFLILLGERSFGKKLCQFFFVCTVYQISGYSKSCLRTVKKIESCAGEFNISVSVEKIFIQFFLFQMQKGIHFISQIQAFDNMFISALQHPVTAVIQMMV